MLRVVSTKDRDINYTLTYKNVKNINLRIKFDGSVCVSAPKYIDVFRIDDFVISKGEYVLSSIEKFKKMQGFKKAPKKYVSGESFKILGKDLRLKVIISNDEEVYSDGVFIYLKVCNDDFLKKQNLINKWISEKTVEIYNEIANEVYKKFEKYGVSFPEIKIRKMSTRWGSCQPTKGVITINSRLIEASRICIEYVMMHEFCHFIHANHSKNFYLLLQVMMPDWKYRKNILESSIYF